MRTTELEVFVGCEGYLYPDIKNTIIAYIYIFDFNDTYMSLIKLKVCD